MSKIISSGDVDPKVVYNLKNDASVANDDFVFINHDDYLAKSEENSIKSTNQSNDVDEV